MSLVLVANTSAPLTAVALLGTAVAALIVIALVGAVVYAVRRFTRVGKPNDAEAEADTRIENYAARTLLSTWTAIATVPALLYSAGRTLINRLIGGWQFLLFVAAAAVFSLVFLYFQDPIVIALDTAYEFAGRAVRDYFALPFVGVPLRLAYDAWVGVNNAALQWIMLIGGETAIAALRCASQNAVALAVGGIRFMVEINTVFVEWATSSTALQRAPDWAPAFEGLANTTNLLDQFGFCMCLDLGYLWSAFFFLPPGPFGRLVNATINTPLITALLVPVEAYTTSSRPRFTPIAASMYNFADASRDFTDEYIAAFDTDIRMFGAYLCFRAGGDIDACIANDAAFDFDGDRTIVEAAREANDCTEESTKGGFSPGEVLAGASCTFDTLAATRPSATGLSMWPGHPWGPTLETAFTVPFPPPAARRRDGIHDYGPPPPPPSRQSNASDARRARRDPPAAALRVWCDADSAVLFDPFNPSATNLPDGILRCHPDCDGTCNPCDLSGPAGTPSCTACPPGGYVACYTEGAVSDPYVYPPGATGDDRLASIDVPPALAETACLPAIVCPVYAPPPTPIDAFLGNATFLRTSPSHAWSCAPWRAQRAGISFLNYTANALLAWDTITAEHLHGEAFAEELFSLCDCIDEWGRGVLPLYALRNATHYYSHVCRIPVAYVWHAWLVGVDTLDWLRDVTNDYTFDEFRIWDPEYGAATHPENPLAGAVRFISSKYWDNAFPHTLYDELEDTADALRDTWGSLYIDALGYYIGGLLRIFATWGRLLSNIGANVARMPFFWVQTGIDFNPFFDALKEFARFPGAIMRVLGGACGASEAEPDTALGEVVRWLWEDTIGLSPELIPPDSPACCLANLMDGTTGAVIDFARVQLQFWVQTVPAVIWNTAIPYIDILPGIDETDYSLEVSRPNYDALIADVDAMAQAMGCLYSWNDFYVLSSSPIERGAEICTVYVDADTVEPEEIRLRQVVARTAEAIFRYGGRLVYTLTVFPENMMGSVLTDPEHPGFNGGAFEQLIDEWTLYATRITRWYGHLYNCYYTSSDVLAEQERILVEGPPGNVVFPDDPISDCYGDDAQSVLINPGCVVVHVADAFDTLVTVRFTDKGTEFITNVTIAIVDLYELAASIATLDFEALLLEAVESTRNVIEPLLNFFQAVINIILNDFWVGLIQFLNDNFIPELNFVINLLESGVNISIGGFNTGLNLMAGQINQGLHDVCVDVDNMLNWLCDVLLSLIVGVNDLWTAATGNNLMSFNVQTCKNRITAATCDDHLDAVSWTIIDPISVTDVPDIPWLPWSTPPSARRRDAVGATLPQMSLGPEESTLVQFVGSSGHTAGLLAYAGEILHQLHTDNTSLCTDAMARFASDVDSVQETILVYNASVPAQLAYKIAALRTFSYDYDAPTRALLVRCTSADAIVAATWMWDNRTMVDLPLDALSSERTALELAGAMVHGFAHLAFSRVLPIGTLWAADASQPEAYYTAVYDYLTRMGVPRAHFVATMWVRAPEVIAYLAHPFITSSAPAPAPTARRSPAHADAPVPPAREHHGAETHAEAKARADAIIDDMLVRSRGDDTAAAKKKNRRTLPDGSAWSIGVGVRRLATSGALKVWMSAPTLGDMRRATLRGAILRGDVRAPGDCTVPDAAATNATTELSSRRGAVNGTYWTTGTQPDERRRSAAAASGRVCGTPAHVRCEPPYCSVFAEVHVPRGGVGIASHSAEDDDTAADDETPQQMRRRKARSKARNIIRAARSRVAGVMDRHSTDGEATPMPSQRRRSKEEARAKRPPAATPLHQQQRHGDDGGPFPERAYALARIDAARMHARGASIDALVQHLHSQRGGTFSAFTRGVAAARSPQHSSAPLAARLEAEQFAGGDSKRRANGGGGGGGAVQDFPPWLDDSIVPSPVRMQERDCPEVRDWPIHCSVLTENVCATAALARNLAMHYQYRVTNAAVDGLGLFNRAAADAAALPEDFVPYYPPISHENWGAFIPQALFPSDKLITSVEGLAEASRDTPLLATTIDIVDWALKIDTRAGAVEAARFMVDTNTSASPPETLLGYVQDFSTCRYHWDVEATRYASLGGGVLVWLLSLLAAFYIGNYVPGVTAFLVTVVSLWPLGVLYVVYGWAPSCSLTPLLTIKPAVIALSTAGLMLLAQLPLPNIPFVPQKFIPDPVRLIPLVGIVSHFVLLPALPPALVDDLYELVFFSWFAQHLPWPAGLVVRRSPFPINAPPTLLGPFIPMPATDVFPCRAGLFPDTSYNVAWALRFLAPGAYEAWATTSISILGVPLRGFPFNLLLDMSARFAAFPPVGVIATGSALETWCWLGTLGNMLVGLLLWSLFLTAGVLVLLALAALFFTVAAAWSAAVSAVASSAAIQLVDRAREREEEKAE